MDESIKFVSSAFRHTISEEDIRWVMKYPLYEDLMEGYLNKYLVLGYDTKRRLLEIMYNRISEDTVKVFHAMKCTTQYLPFVGF
ncbi:hypothetical protein AGMMS49944_22710 [Spirochaetia bacterium]|nr:hypothetical protein AGMMS49944_22710 [Spirochaetia bacterium]